MKPMLAKNYDSQEVSGWMISEKLDGVRAIWDGEKLISRNGNTFAAPAWFLSALPADTMLDGELYIGRGRFQETVGICRSSSGDWAAIRFHVFDCISTGIFSDRLAMASAAIAGSSVAVLVQHQIADSFRDEAMFFSSVKKAGGEGIMLRNPESKYTHGRSSNLLKYKVSDADEAEVIGFEFGAGKLANLIGALVVKWQGITFKVGAGMTLEDRSSTPQIGSLVTFSFSGLTDSGCPRFPTFIAIRNYE